MQSIKQISLNRRKKSSLNKVYNNIRIKRYSFVTIWIVFQMKQRMVY